MVWKCGAVSRSRQAANEGRDRNHDRGPRTEGHSRPDTALMARTRRLQTGGLRLRLIRPTRSNSEGGSDMRDRPGVARLSLRSSGLLAEHSSSIRPHRLEPKIALARRLPRAKRAPAIKYVMHHRSEESAGACSQQTTPIKNHMKSEVRFSIKLVWCTCTTAAQGAVSRYQIPWWHAASSVAVHTFLLHIGPAFWTAIFQHSRSPAMKEPR